MFPKRDIRAVLITVAIAVNVFQGCPVPNIQRRHIERPLGQREVERWAHFLNEAGWETTPAELTQDVLRWSETGTRWHGAMLEPVWPWFHYTQTRQRWSLFPIADPDPWWMHLEASTDQRTWELLYRPLDPEHDFMKETLEYRRVRGVWNPGTAGPRADQSRFVTWIARRVFAQRPEFESVRVRYQRYHVFLPDETRTDIPSTWHFEERRTRAELGLR